MKLTKAVSGRYIFDLLDAQMVADKLGLLEDIEEGLGIDLIELLSAKEIRTAKEQALKEVKDKEKKKLEKIMMNIVKGNKEI